MSSPRFRRLRVELPRQPVVDQRPWLAAGVLAAFIILLMCVCAYYYGAKEKTSSRQQNEKYKTSK